MEINNQSVINQIVEHARAIAALVSEPLQEKVSLMETPADAVSVKDIAERIFQKMECPGEETRIKINFITSRMRSRGFLNYRFENGTRLYKATPLAETSWLILPPECKENPEYEFPSTELQFRTAELSSMLYDLWLGTKQRFDKEFAGYKDFLMKMRTQ